MASEPIPERYGPFVVGVLPQKMESVSNGVSLAVCVTKQMQAPQRFARVSVIRKVARFQSIGSANGAFGLRPQGAQDKLLRASNTEPLSLPCLAGRTSPCRRFSRPKSPLSLFQPRNAPAAWRVDSSSSTADTTRSRRSRLYGFPSIPPNY